MRLDAQEAIRIKNLVSKNIDWAYLVRTARAHGVMPLLYRTLNSTCSAAVPTQTLAELREHFYHNTGRNLFLAKELLKLLNLFEVHAIPAIPYKGPVLSASIYGNFALRDFGDLDILVRERDYERAQRLLLDHGFRLTIEHEWEKELVDESGRIAVDLHQRIAPRDFPSPLSFDYLSKRLQPTSLIGTTVASLSPLDTLLMLSIQVTKDRFFKLAKLCDVAELLRRHWSLNWGEALIETKKLGAQRKVLFALCLASNLPGTALPQEVVRELKLHASIYELVEHALQQFFCATDSITGGQSASRQFGWLMRERFRDKAGHYYFRYVRDVIVPCELDRQVLSLSSRVSFLYYVVRPARLLWKYAALLFKAKIHRRQHSVAELPN